MGVSRNGGFFSKMFIWRAFVASQSPPAPTIRTTAGQTRFLHKATPHHPWKAFMQDAGSNIAAQPWQRSGSERLRPAHPVLERPELGCSPKGSHWPHTIHGYNNTDNSCAYLWRLYLCLAARASAWVRQKPPSHMAIGICAHALVDQSKWRRGKPVGLPSM